MMEGSKYARQQRTQRAFKSIPERRHTLAKLRRVDKTVHFATQTIEGPVLDPYLTNR
ncbi:MAG: hypothetical protein QX188_04165 [Methylococcaceae bacterium]